MLMCEQMLSSLAHAATRGMGVALIVAVLAGCAAAPTRQNPVTREAQESTTIAGIPGARHWGDRAPPGIERWLNASETELKRDYGGIFGVPHTYLAISGGGADGAFGAGLLVGWTAHGTRPEFTVVTGISTGALIAPFAFLGPKYDPLLRKVYTELSTDDLIERRGLLDIVRNDALASSRPLRKLIAQYIDDAVIAELAAEHRRGRSLLVSTTNLDAGRPVTWNITRIAASGAPGARELIHDVVLASASIPGVFPPVTIEVEANGRTYEELHVDGGATSQVFMYPVGLRWRKVLDQLQVPGRPKLYVIRNSRTDPAFQSIQRRLVPIMGRSVSSLIRSQGIGDLALIYFATERDGVHFNLAHVPDDFTLEPKESFDRDYMRALFEIGYAAARKGYPWITGPKAPE
jgi:predicted acylesterase/phospholipase RssA